MTIAPAARATRAAAIAVAIGISSCSSTTSLSAMTARTSAEFTLNCAFAPGATTMLFSAAASTTMAAVPLGPGSVTTPSSPTSLALQVCAQLLGGGVAAQRGDELHRCARAGGGHRLIAALAARRRRQRGRQNGLAGARQSVHGEREIGVDTAHYADPRGHNCQS